MIRQRTLSRIEYAESFKRQRNVLQLMLYRVANAKEALKSLSCDHFDKVQFRAGFEAFRQLDLSQDEAIDIVDWTRVTQEVLRGWSYEATAAELADLVDFHEPPVMSIAVACRKLRDYVGGQALADLGTHLVRNGTDLTVNPRDLVRHVQERIAEIGSQQMDLSENPFARGGTLRRLVEEEPEMPPFLLGEILPEGSLAFLAGQPAVCKTWLSFQLAAAVATGSPFFGLTTMQVTVCMVPLETPDWSLYQRINAIGLGDWLDRVHVATPTSLKRSSLDLTKDTDLRQIIDWVKSQGARLVVLDPFTYLHGLGENAAEDAKGILRALDQIRHETGAAVLVLHHERKGKSDGKEHGSDLDVMRGSSALGGAADVVLRLKRSEGRIQLRFSKVRSGRTPKPIWLVQSEEGPLVASEAPVAAVQGKEDRLEATRAVLSEATAWLSTVEITQQLKNQGHEVSESTVRSQYLSALVESGEVVRRGKRGPNVRYRWAESVKGEMENEVDERV